MDAASVTSSNGSSPKVIVTGCLAQRYSDDLAKALPEADMIMGFENYGSLPEELSSLLGAKERSVIPRVQVTYFRNCDPIGRQAIFVAYVLMKENHSCLL